MPQNFASVMNRTSMRVSVVVTYFSAPKEVFSDYSQIIPVIGLSVGVCYLRHASCVAYGFCSC